MARNGHYNSCPLVDEIVGYIYGEMGNKAGSDFEMHLAGCTVCTDEFAAVAYFRFSVYEWKKEAFDPLATPDIAIPYHEPVLLPWPPAKWIFTVKAWAEIFRMPVAVAAGLAICVALVALAFNYIGSAEQHVASNIGLAAEEILAPVMPTNVERSDKVATGEPQPTVRRVRASSPAPRRVVETTPSKRSRVSNFVPDRAIQAQKAPALTPDQESDDNSLRLADLFEEVGG